MSPARALFDKLGPVWQALLALGGAVAFGMLVALVFAGWVNLPAKVETQADAIASQGEDLDMLKRRIERIDCVVVSIATDVNPIIRCGL